MQNSSVPKDLWAPELPAPQSHPSSPALKSVLHQTGDPSPVASRTKEAVVLAGFSPPSDFMKVS